MILFALLFALLFGMAVGTLIRRRMEEPTRYIGRLAPPSYRSADRALSAPSYRLTGRALSAPSLPLHVAAAVAGVLEARQHEEQVG